MAAIERQKRLKLWQASKHTHTISPFCVLGSNQLCDNTCVGITTNRKIEEGVAWERG